MTTKTQRKANRKKWVAALRSGEYKQGKGCLENANGEFCCIGVLAKLAGVDRTVSTGKNALNQSIIYDGQIGSASDKVKEWIGLVNEVGMYAQDDGWEDLARLNDNGHTFEDIAAIIESEPEGMFED